MGASRRLQAHAWRLSPSLTLTLALALALTLTLTLHLSPACRLRASQSAAPGDLATLEAMLQRRLQHERAARAPAPAAPAAPAAPELVCANGVCQRVALS